MENNQGKKNSYSSNSSAEPVFYEIKVQGQLDLLWSKWFEGMTLAHVENGESGMACTLIAGPVIDQSALHGLLTKIRDLNLTLISVRRFIPGTNVVEEVPIRPEPPGDRDDLRNKG
jgi:hypothetical protein